MIHGRRRVSPLYRLLGLRLQLQAVQQYLPFHGDPRRTGLVGQVDDNNGANHFHFKTERKQEQDESLWVTIELNTSTISAPTYQTHC